MNIRASFLMLAVAVAACGGSPTEPTKVTPTPKHGLRISVTGDEQTAMATYNLPQTVVVTAVDTATNLPVSGVKLVVRTNGNGTLHTSRLYADSVDTLTTDVSGKASVSWRLGHAVGHQSVTTTVIASPIPASVSPAIISADVVSGGGVGANATVPRFFDSRLGYTGWSNGVMGFLVVLIPANVAWPLDSIGLMEVDSAGTKLGTPTYTVTDVRWEGDSTGPIARPSCTIANNALTCTRAVVGTCIDHYGAPMVDPSQPHRIGSFHMTVTLTTPSDSALRHIKSGDYYPYPSGHIDLRVQAYDHVDPKYGPVDCAL